MIDLTNLTISKTRTLLNNKTISATGLTKAYLERIEKHSRLNAFITVCSQSALQQAKEADKQISQGKSLPLLGIPIALKDMFSTKGIKTTAASKVLADYIPQYDATVVAKLKKNGAIILGKTNQDTWAHGSSGENSDFGPTKNPYDQNYVPGGSSSGSAVAVRSDMCVAASGTDTGGSIRQPAAFCNVVGLKPTYGRVSRYGVIAMASSLDAVGHLTKTVEDSAIYLQVTAGYDKHDATSSNINVPNFLSTMKKGVKKLKIGIPKEYFSDSLDKSINNLIQKALQELTAQGAEIVEISLPHTEYALACYYIIMPSEVSSNLARYDGIRYGQDRASFSDEAKRRILLGTFTLSSGYYDAYYKKAMYVRSLLIDDFNKAWKKVDIIATPISPMLPWKIGEKVNNPLQMYLADIMSVTANLTGIPGLSLPVGFAGRFPVGMQFLAPHFCEERLFQTAYAYEQKNPWYRHVPKI